jgi:hypothetical protein
VSDTLAAAAEPARKDCGSLDLLVKNAAICNTREGSLSLQEYAKITRASNASLDEIRAVWETNVFGTLGVYQAMLPLLRESSDARIIDVSSAVGSLGANAIKVNLVSPGSPRRTSTDMKVPCLSKMVHARWCASRCWDRMARPAHSRAGKTLRSHGDEVLNRLPRFRDPDLGASDLMSLKQ